jgi:hypothetical protein
LGSRNSPNSAIAGQTGARVIRSRTFKVVIGLPRTNRQAPMAVPFALQLGCMHHFLISGVLPAGVYGVPEEIDQLVAEEKLRSEGINLDTREIG